MPRCELRRRAEPVPGDDFVVHVRLDPPQRAGEGVLQVRERDDVPAGAEDAVEEPALVGQQRVVGRRVEADEGPVRPLEHAAALDLLDAQVRRAPARSITVADTSIGIGLLVEDRADESRRHPGGRAGTGPRPCPARPGGRRLRRPVGDRRREAWRETGVPLVTPAGPDEGTHDGEGEDRGSDAGSGRSRVGGGCGAPADGRVGSCRRGRPAVGWRKPRPGIRRVTVMPSPGARPRAAKVVGLPALAWHWVSLPVSPSKQATFVEAAGAFTAT